MERREILDKVQDIIRDMFDIEDAVITDETVAADVPGWDSLMHITLVGTIEDEFDVRFAMKDVVGLKNVGQLIDLIEEQVD